MLLKPKVEHVARWNRGQVKSGEDSSKGVPAMGVDRWDRGMEDSG